MNEFKNIPLPSQYDKTDDVTISDVIKAIETIVKFSSFRSRINKILDSLVEYGIDISAINSPEQLMRQLIRIRSKDSENRTISVEDINDIIKEFEEFSKMKLSDIDRSIKIIAKYNSISRSIDGVMRLVSKQTITEDALLSFAKSILGANGNRKRKKHEDEEEFEISKPSDKDIEDIKRIISEM